MTRYFRAVDGLRAVAVLSVVLFHLHEQALPGGFVGVDVFFVISGFVVTAAITSRPATSLLGFLGDFYTRRILRIMPALVFCLVLVCLARTLFIPSAWLSNLVSQTALAAYFGMSNIVLALNVDDYFSPRTAFNPFVHTWSLGVEEQFYLVFPFLIYYFHLDRRRTKEKRTAVAVLVGLVVLSFITCGVLAFYRWQYSFYLLPSRFWELGCGAILSLTMEWWRPRLETLHPRSAFLAGLFAAALLTASFMTTAAEWFPFPLGVLPTAASTMLIALVVAQPKGIFGRALGVPAIVFIGQISYSLYLWHWPIFVLVRWTVGLDGLFAATAVVVSFVCAIVSYFFVELPIRQWRLSGTESTSRPYVVGAVVAAVLIAFTGSVAMFKFRSALTLSVTRETRDWYPDPTRELGPSSVGCKLVTAESMIERVSVTDWSPEDCQTGRSARRLHVVGDSHAGAYVPMLRQFALEGAFSVRMYSHAGCAFISLDAPIRRQRADCVRSHSAIITILAHSVLPGDIVFLPSLRVPRYKEVWGELGMNGARVSQTDDQVKILGTEATLEAEAILMKIGARVVFEAPKPIFKSPPFRCADWFNAKNGICAGGFDIDRRELEELRRPILERMRIVASRQPSVTVWDPFPVLCPLEVCHAFRDNKPLFFDGDHISGYGNDVLLNSFKNHIAMVASAP